MASKILVVDDDTFILDALEELLHYSGYEVITTPKGEEVFNEVEKNFPDLILLDIMLSGTDGRDICRLLKSNAKTKDIPVIMISAHPAAYEAVKDVGANDIVAKPFDIHNLLSKIELQLSA
ncbi:MAG TPA: response regulator [Sphingobacteriaceae bacterium]|nr:response regulator [Sphingobacteriaceae bacterium]